MNLDFSGLSTILPKPPRPNTWGQVGTVGTPAFMRVPAHRGVGDKAGTGGDDEGKGAAADAAFEVAADPHRGLPCPQVSPPRPQALPAPEPNEISVSPVSPLVPGLVASRVSAEEIEREAFEERAAIMEFDGGMTRADAEAAALLCCVARNNERRQS